MDYGELDRIIDRHGAGRVISEVAPYLTEARRTRIDSVLSGRLSSLHVAVERPQDPHNAAAVVRSAEAFGVMHVHVIDAPEGTLHAGQVTQGSFNWLHTHHHADQAAFLGLTRAGGVRVAGALMKGQVAVDDLPVDAPLCVLFGNEKTGLSPELQAECDLTFRIPMVGMSESLNLSVSAAISLYLVSRARRALLSAPGDLAGEELLRERARYYARSIEPRMLDGLFG
jgi:tRNA (guanosine-2'-O-)-methyltransferase